jgi:hypothetical protein
VSEVVWEEVEDMTPLLEKLQKGNAESEETPGGEEPED